MAGFTRGTWGIGIRLTVTIPIIRTIHYDGPIYGYNGLSPDQIIANVQYALQQLGYFAESVDGVLGPVTQQAIADYQLDNGLNVTGAIDRPTLVALGFVD